MSEDAYIYETHAELIKEHSIAQRPLSELVGEIQDLYCADNRSWIIGFSGGKDSTAVVSLIYTALLGLKPKQRSKHVYVVSSDTLVETPVVVDMIKNVMAQINKTAKKREFPMTAHPVHPKMDQSFWANLLGRGYPAPQQTFRWCTERMKIDPVSEFITDKVSSHGEVIVALGSRSKESASRAQVIGKHQIAGSLLARHTSLPNAYTYMPIVDWDADEVWEYLMLAPTPWGNSNRILFELYKGSNQGECPIVIDKSTPSCGNSRFGCWTCTVVEKDRAIHGLIESGEEWMRPLLNFRNELHHSTRPENKNDYRNFKRRTGKVSYARGDLQDDTGDVAEKKHIPGPYWMKQRQIWLKRLLKMEKEMRDSGRPIDLIDRKELMAIRQEWMRDPNEPDWMDSLPAIYAEVYPDDPIEWVQSDMASFSVEDNETLMELSKERNISADMIIKLLSVENEMSGLAVRKKIFDKLEGVLNKDWGTLEEITSELDSKSDLGVWDDKLAELRTTLESIR